MANIKYDKERAEIIQQYLFGGISGTELSKKYGIPRSTIVKMAEQYRHKNNIKAPCRDLPARKWFNEDLQERWDKTIAKFENVEYVKVKTDGVRDLMEELACK